MENDYNTKKATSILLKDYMMFILGLTSPQLFICVMTIITSLSGIPHLPTSRLTIYISNYKYLLHIFGVLGMIIMVLLILYCKSVRYHRKSIAQFTTLAVVLFYGLVIVSFLVLVTFFGRCCYYWCMVILSFIIGLQTIICLYIGYKYILLFIIGQLLSDPFCMMANRIVSNLLSLSEDGNNNTNTFVPFVNVTILCCIQVFIVAVETIYSNGELSTEKRAVEYGDIGSTTTDISSSTGDDELDINFTELRSDLNKSSPFIVMLIFSGSFLLYYPGIAPYLLIGQELAYKIDYTCMSLITLSCLFYSIVIWWYNCIEITWLQKKNWSWLYILIIPIILCGVLLLLLLHNHERNLFRIIFYNDYLIGGILVITSICYGLLYTISLDACKSYISSKNSPFVVIISYLLYNIMSMLFSFLSDSYVKVYKSYSTLNWPTNEMTTIQSLIFWITQTLNMGFKCTISAFSTTNMIITIIQPE